MDQTMSDYWRLADAKVKDAYNKALDKGIVIPCTLSGVRRAHVELSFKYTLLEGKKKGVPVYRASINMEGLASDYLLEGSLDPRIEPLFLGRRVTRDSLEEVLKHLTKILTGQNPDENNAPAFTRVVKVLGMWPKEALSLDQLAELMKLSINRPMGRVVRQMPDNGDLPRKFILPLEVTPWAMGGIKIRPVPYFFMKAGKTRWRYRVLVESLWAAQDKFEETVAAVFCSRRRPRIIERLLCQLDEAAKEAIQRKTSGASFSGTADDPDDMNTIPAISRD